MDYIITHIYSLATWLFMGLLLSLVAGVAGWTIEASVNLIKKIGG